MFDSKKSSPFFVYEKKNIRKKMNDLLNFIRQKHQK